MVGEMTHLMSAMGRKQSLPTENGAADRWVVELVNRDRRRGVPEDFAALPILRPDLVSHWYRKSVDLHATRWNSLTKNGDFP